MRAPPASRCPRGRYALALVAWAMLVSSPMVAKPVRRAMIVERVVMLVRHGVRAPLSGEVPPGTRTSAPWPTWPLAEGRLTPHGAAALAAQARGERAWLVARGVIDAEGCPAPGTVRIWTNTAERTIASGAAFAAGLTPGCAVAVGHLGAEAVDPLFEPLRAPGQAFDAGVAIAAIQRFTGGVDRAAARQHGALRLLDHVLGCGDPAGCDPGGVAGVAPATDGHGIDLTGPVRTASGTAQVLLLEYLKGFPLAQVGWGRAGPATIRRLGALHAALFDVFTRPPYMTMVQAGPVGRHIADALARAAGPDVEILVGHDTNVTALAAALRVDLIAPGYAANDVPPGGALVVERVRDARDGRRYVRLSYHSQSPVMIRGLGTGVDRVPLAIRGCSAGARAVCPLARFVRLLRGRVGDKD